MSRRGETRDAGRRAIVASGSAIASLALLLTAPPAVAQTFKAGQTFNAGQSFNAGTSPRGTQSTRRFQAELGGAPSPTHSSGGRDALPRMPLYADAVAMREDASLRSIAFANAQVAVACGARGVIVRSTDGGASWSAVESGVDCCLHDVAWLDGQRGVIVGGAYDAITGISRGVVLRSEDGGESWQRVEDAELPCLFRLRKLDGGVLQVSGDWSPSLLTATLESHDGGRSWTSTRSLANSGTSILASAKPELSPAQLRQWTDAVGAAVSIRDAARIGNDGLCAVGDHGVILLSHDRARNWQITSGRDRHAAVLMVAENPESVAWSLLGSEALEHRNRVHLLVHHLDSRDGSGEPNSRHRTQERSGSGGGHAEFDHARATRLAQLRQATAQVGGAAVDPLATHQASAEQIAQACEDWMQIAKPSVVLIDESLAPAVRDALLQAATASGAARVQMYSFQAAGNLALHRDAMLPRTGVLASDLELDALALVAPERAIARSVALQSLYDLVGEGRRGESVTSGLPLHPEQRLAAPAVSASRHRLQIAQARMQQRQRVTQLLDQRRRPQTFRSAVISLLDQTAAEDRLRLAWQIWLQVKDAERQQVLLNVFRQRFASTSVGRWAGLKLRSIQEGQEWQRLRNRLPVVDSSEASPTMATSVPVSPFQVTPASGDQKTVQQVSAVAPVLVPDSRTPTQVPDRTLSNNTGLNGNRLGVSQQEADDLGAAGRHSSDAVDLMWEFHPLVLLSRESRRRRGEEGTLQPAIGPSANLQRLEQADSNRWTDLLRSTKQTIRVRRAAQPPRLDGKLDDAIWQSALPQAGDRSRLRMAYDDDYVYVAMQWAAEEVGQDPTARSGATRDHDLRDVDRLRLRLDLDRDLLSSMQLQVSDSGRTHDAIDGHADWQPTWYVATRRDEAWVSVELALARRDLLELPIAAGDWWFASLERISAGSDHREPVMPRPDAWLSLRFQ